MFRKPRILVSSILALIVLALVAFLAFRYLGGAAAPLAVENAKDQSVGGGPRIMVETALVQKETFTEETSAVGTVKSNESVVLKPEISGRIATLHFREGETVRSGDLLISLDAGIEAAELQQAEANLALAEANLRRNEDLFQKKFVSQAMLDNSRAALKVEAARVALASARLQKTRIHAPFGGSVGLRNVSVGDYVQQGEAIINLEDTQTLKVDFRLPEMTFSRLRTGLSLEVSADAMPNESRRATLTAIDPLVDAAGRAISCRATLPNRDGRLSPGMFVRVRLKLGEREVLTLPEEAVMVSLAPQVFRVERETARLVNVRLGRRQGNRVAVEGLAVGDVVVTAGQMKLQDGTRVAFKEADAPGAAAESLFRDAPIESVPQS